MFDFFGKPIESLKSKRLFLFDMDGTIYIDGKPFDGVKETLEKIKAVGGKSVFITNNSSKSVTERVAALNAMGIAATAEDFMTSTMAAAKILKGRFGDGKIYVQATNSCVAELKTLGLNVTENEEDVQAILVGFDTELDFEKMKKTCRMLTCYNVPYYATNPDWVCPVAGGYVPDCGSMCFGYEKATRRTPVFIGKPAPLMIELCMEKFGAKREHTLAIGDRLYTDIACGNNADVDTLLVLSGEATAKDAMSGEIKPAFVLPSVKGLLGIL